MTLQSWIIYLTLVTVATSTPGPAVLFIMTNATLYGWKKAIFAALGNITGLLCLGIIAITGVGTILKTSQFIFDCVKFAGAAYLLYLGIKMILQKDSDLAILAKRPEWRSASSGKIFYQALGVALSNPKAIVFLMALFPQFVNVNRELIPQFSMLIATLMCFSFFFLMCYALLAHKAKTWVTTRGRIKAFNRTSGSIFIGFGMLLALSSNNR
jgi:threonine/homoserine/homoserine lactone efflux protein